MRKGQSRTFRQQFPKYVCEGDRITAKLPSGFEATAYIVRDDCNDTPPERDDGFWPSRAPKDAGYIGAKSQRAFQRAHEKAAATLEAWERDEWWYCGVCVVISKAGTQLTGRYDHALWGVDCNYPNPGRFRLNHYLRTVANELLPEALNAAEAKLEQLAG